MEGRQGARICAGWNLAHFSSGLPAAQNRSAAIDLHSCGGTGRGGDLLAIYVVLHLGGSYSIRAEARKPVSGGPYALVRHPLYVAEQIALLGALITYLSWRALVLFAVQSLVQYLRVRNEETVLAQAFPSYANYMRRTPVLLPRWDIGRGRARKFGAIGQPRRSASRRDPNFLQQGFGMV